MTVQKKASRPMSNTSDSFQFKPDFPEFSDRTLKVEVPSYFDVLPDGHAIIISGYPVQHGDRTYNSQDSTTLNLCEHYLRQFGIMSSQIDLIDYALQHGYCHLTDAPWLALSITLDQMDQLLASFAISLSIEQSYSLEDLAQNIESGKSVAIFVNAEKLWNFIHEYYSDESNHLVVVTRLARDRISGEIRGFYVYDAFADAADYFVDMLTMQLAWLDVGGQQLVVDVPFSKADVSA
jgi:hypothetical protein